ncbi:MAG: RluA family pseudouridine synthase [Candidatus Dojkabacteria bacterium]
MYNGFMKADLVTGKRVDLQIMAIKPELSRATIKKLLIGGVILVNGRSVAPNYRPKENEYALIPSNKVRDFLNEANLYKLKGRKMKLVIVYEDNDLLIIDKPSGISSHPETARDTKSLLNGIIFYLDKKGEKTRVRLINRLDKETSGLILAAKNLSAHDFYSKQFEERKIEKTYLAVVHGDFSRKLSDPTNEVVEVRTYISKDRENKHKQRNTDSKKGRLAISEISFVQHFNKFGRKKFSIVKINPKTGRQHQIRVHLAELKHPILGDKIYGGQKYKRVLLHSYSIKLRMLSGEIKTFKSTIPKEFDMKEVKLTN